MKNMDHVRASAQNMENEKGPEDLRMLVPTNVSMDKQRHKVDPGGFKKVSGRETECQRLGKCYLGFSLMAFNRAEEIWESWA